MYGLRPPDRPLLASRQALLVELSEIDVDAMTPLEALTKLYEIKERAGESGNG